MESMGRLVIFAGVILIVVGILLTAWDRIPLLGKLPGDIHYRRGNFHFYFPLATSLLLSVILTLLVRYLGRR